MPRRPTPAALVAALATAAAVVAAPAASRQPAPPAETLGAYIVGGYRSPDDWQFLMGPRDSVRMVMRLVRMQPDGGVAFVCRREDGLMSMGVTMRGRRAAPGESAEFMVGVLERRHPLRMEVRAEAPEGEDSVYEAEGQAVADILAALGTIPEGRTGALLFELDGRTLRFPAPEPRALAMTAALVCDGWGRQAVDRRIVPAPDGRGELILPGAR